MKFFLTGLGNLSENWPHIRAGVLEADKHGFYGVLMPDHYMWGGEIGHRMANPYHTLETWTALTYLAAETTSVMLGTLVTPLPLRHPAVLAKRLATLDNLSGGRVLLGVGAGWSKVEFKGYSEWLEAPRRVTRTVEALNIIKRLWTEPEVTHISSHYRVEGAVLEPKPLQKPHPPLLFGSSGARMLRVTGREGDICFIPPWQQHRFHEVVEAVSRVAEEAGRKGAIAFAAGLMSAQGPYEADSYIRLAEEVEGKGCEYCMVAFPRETVAGDIKRFSEEVLPSF